MEILEHTIRQTHDWASDRICYLCEKGDPDELENAFSIEQEFDEWLGNLDKDHDIYSLTYIGEGSEFD